MADFFAEGLGASYDRSRRAYIDLIDRWPAL